MGNWYKVQRRGRSGHTGRARFPMRWDATDCVQVRWDDGWIEWVQVSDLTRLKVLR